MYLLFIIISLSISSVSESQNVTFYGSAPSYSNREIIFCRYSDMISMEEEEIGRCKVDAEGSFKVSFELETTTFILSHLGIYKAFLYAEPDKTYEIILPVRVDKSPEDELNPYYIESRIQLGIVNVNSEELNFLIRMFNDAYTPYYNKHISGFISNDDFSELEEDIERMEKPFTNSTNRYFNDYREYRYGLLKFLSSQKRAVNTHNAYFSNKPVLYNNPAYMELFNQVYDRYFMFYGRSGEGKEIFNKINVTGSYRELKKILGRNNILRNDTILELVVLKQIFNEFYNDDFSRSGLLRILDTLISETGIKQHKLIAGIIRNKITKLLAGHDPPAFKLYDTDSTLVTLSDFKGRYVYLSFCVCNSYSCISEFELMKGINERHREKLEIITINIDSDTETTRDFIKKNNYKWKFLYYVNQPQVIKDYDIRAYPTCFLIGPDGKLIQSPAPAPSENFESGLIKIMKARGDL